MAATSCTAGPPDPTQVLDLMQCEHTELDDADSDLYASNYDTTTSSRIEWYFVYVPQRVEGGATQKTAPRTTSPACTPIGLALGHSGA